MSISTVLQLEQGYSHPSSREASWIGLFGKCLTYLRRVLAFFRIPTEVGPPMRASLQGVSLEAPLQRR